METKGALTAATYLTFFQYQNQCFTRCTQVNRPDGNGNPFWKRILLFIQKLFKRIVMHSRARPYRYITGFALQKNQVYIDAENS
jgi:hypothetical protein